MYTTPLRTMLQFIHIYFGILTPGWQTYRAFANGQRNIIILWLKYWVIFALLQGLGYITDILFGGSLLYTRLKLLLAVFLWFSYPDSTKTLYQLIEKPVLRSLEQHLANHGYKSLGQPLYQFFLTSNQEDTHHIGELSVNAELLKRELGLLLDGINGKSHRGEPQVNAELLKRELRILMEDIDGGATSSQESTPRQRNLHNRQAVSSINYLVPHYRVHYSSEDEQSDSM
ncbi:protein YOP1 homolog [Drosophila kikkawai]|uniref:Protein YOP1 homolog n=1 Tax=Drosophila kikkawai TaxID=30033 RepID=A0A6P4IFP2_DROKI|nr:uncharacterized protein LOC108078044 [Drosophila kikkawai]